MKYVCLLFLFPLLMGASPDLSGISPDEKDKVPPGVIPDDLAPKTDQEAAERVATVFIDTLLKGKAQALAKLGTDPFYFAGRRVSEISHIEKEWKDVYKRMGKKLPDSEQMQMEVLDYKATVKKFGKPPSKYKNLKLNKCFFAVVSFARRRGLLLILTKDKKAGWMVTGVTD